MNIRKTLILLATIPLSFSPLHADLRVYEPFSYTVASSLNGQNGGSGFSTNPWKDNESKSGDSEILSGSLVYGPLAYEGNSALLTGPIQFNRNISTINGVDGQTTWLSFLVRLLTPEPASENAFITVRPNTSSGQAAQFGMYYNEGDMRLGIGASQGTISTTVLSSEVASPITTYLIVASITWDTASGAPEFISLYSNPQAGSIAPPAEAIATRNDLNIATSPGTNRIFNIMITGGGTGNEWVFDEIRIGDSYADVVPWAIPEPSSLMLLGLVSAGALALRRRSTR